MGGEGEYGAHGIAIGSHSSIRGINTLELMKAPREQRASGRNVNRDRPASDPFPCTANSPRAPPPPEPFNLPPRPAPRSLPHPPCQPTLPLCHYQHDHRAAHNTVAPYILFSRFEPRFFPSLIAVDADGHSLSSLATFTAGFATRVTA